MKRRCESCPPAPPRDPGPGAFCQWCGSSAVVTIDDDTDGEPKRGSTVQVVSADEIENMRPLVPCQAPIFNCLGGYGKGTVVAVSAPPGHGKTTECLRVAVAQNASILHLVEGEASDEQVKAAALDAGASARWIRAKKLRIVRAETWQDAAEFIDRACRSRNKPEFAAWDSTTMWVPGREEEEREFIKTNVDLAAEHDIVIFAICQWSQQGRGRGTLTIPHGSAIWIEIKPGEFIVKKARPPWSGKQASYTRPFLKPGQTWPGQEIAETKERKT